MLLILLAYRVFHFPELFLDFGNKLIQSTLEKKKKKKMAQSVRVFQ